MVQTVGLVTVVHSPSALHDSPPEPVQVPPVEILHFIPDAQSESTEHGPSSHVMITLASQAATGTGAGHSSPGAHFALPSDAHELPPVTWQVKPCPQSESVLHDVDARASRSMNHVPPTSTTTATPN